MQRSFNQHSKKNVPDTQTQKLIKVAGRVAFIWPMLVRKVAQCCTYIYVLECPRNFFQKTIHCIHVGCNVWVLGWKTLWYISAFMPWSHHLVNADQDIAWKSPTGAATTRTTRTQINNNDKPQPQWQPPLQPPLLLPLPLPPPASPPPLPGTTASVSICQQLSFEPSQRHLGCKHLNGQMAESPWNRPMIQFIAAVR